MSNWKDKYKKDFLVCECGQEALIIEWFTDEEQIYLSFFERGLYSQNKLSFLQRIRYCWKTLITGKPFADCMILDKQNTSKLIEVLTTFKDYEFKGEEEDNE